MKKNRLFVVFLVVIATMFVIGGFISVEYGGILPDRFVAVACIIVSLLTLTAVLVGNYHAKKFSFVDLIPIIALVVLIILANLFLARPVREVPQSTSVNNSNVNGGSKK